MSCRHTLERSTRAPGSTRFIIFDESTRIVAETQREHEQIYPQPGWVEHDATEIWRNTQTVIAGVGDTSNLILEPDLDTYYLRDAALLKLPEADLQLQA